MSGLPKPWEPVWVTMSIRSKNLLFLIYARLDHLTSESYDVLNNSSFQIHQYLLLPFVQVQVARFLKMFQQICSLQGKCHIMMY